MTTALRIDDLTKLPLRSAFIEAAAAAMAEARARGEPVSLLVMDVDHFKLINDTFGHLQGDDVLVTVAGLLRGNLRAADVAARYAGDEFVALLPGTGAEGARETAERIAQAVRGHAFRLRDRPGTATVTLSIGAAVFPEQGDEPDALFAAADRALYQVKRQGRDGVAVAAGDGTRATQVPLGIERFVGRAHELRSLVTLLESAGEGNPQVAAIRGEAGVGKTTLLRQLEPEVRLRTGSLVVGRCSEADVKPPYGPWAEIIAAIRRLGPGDPAAPGRAWRELPRLVPALGALPDDQGGSRYQLLEEIAEYLRLASRDRPLVVVLDDMQWADGASWDVLEYLVPQFERERLLVCLTIRAEELVGEPLERRRRLSRSERFHEIALSRLSRDELRQWVAAAFHRQEVGRELLAFLYRHTEGNPLFVVQVLRTLVDEGAVWHSGTHWEWRPVSELRLPVAVGDLVSRRLARLSPRARDVLTVAAVIGREFDVDLALDAGAGTEDELLDAIDEGVRFSVLEPGEERASDRWAFSHGLLAEVLREDTNPRRLRKTHERVAQALERRSPDAHAALARHYDQGGDAGRAYRYALLAAAQARQVYAHLEGTEFLRIAERNAAGPAQLAEVRVRLAELAEAAGRYEEAEELCDLAVEWFAAQRDRRRELAVRLMRERIRGLLGQPARQTLERLAALDEESRGTPFDAERVTLLRMLSQAHGRLGERAAAEAMAWECVRLAERSGTPALAADALLRLGVALEHDQLAQAIEIHHRALAMYRTVGDLRGQGNCHNNLGKYATLRGDWEAAVREFSTAIAVGRQVATPDVWGVSLVNLGVVHLKCGEHDRARDLFGEALALFGGLRSSEWQMYALYNLAHLERARGDEASATELYEVVAGLAQRVGQSDVEIGARAGTGLALLGQARLEEARAACAAAAERVRSRSDWFQGRELVEALAVRVAGEAGAADEAVRRHEEARALAEPSDFYGAATLVAECGETLLRLDPERGRRALGEYAPRVRTAGFRALQLRYDELLSRA